MARMTESRLTPVNFGGAGDIQLGFKRILKVCVILLQFTNTILARNM